MTKEIEKLVNLQEVKAKKDNLSFYFDMIDGINTDGDIFKIARKVQDDAVKEGYDVTNMVEIYKWLMEHRNSAA